MLLIDFSSISRPMVYGADKSKEDFDKTYKYLIFKTLLDIIKKHHNKEEDIVIAIDSSKYWRRDHFANYKANRKKKRKEDHLDWNHIFNLTNSLLKDLKENFQFKIIECHGCEADDIMATLVSYINEHVTMISTDSDSYQYHNDRLSQFTYDGRIVDESYVKRNLPIREDIDIDPETFLKIKILNGDGKDDVPNFLSEDDSVLEGGKSVKLGPLTSYKILNGNLKYGTLDSIENSDNYKRNEKMLNLSMIPQDLKDSIINEYISYKIKGTYKTISSYLKKNFKSLSKDASNFLIKKNFGKGGELFFNRGN